MKHRFEVSIPLRFQETETKLNIFNIFGDLNLSLSEQDDLKNLSHFRIAFKVSEMPSSVENFDFIKNWRLIFEKLKVQVHI